MRHLDRSEAEWRDPCILPDAPRTAIYPNQSTFFLRFAQCALWLGVSHGAVLSAQTLDITLVDGRSGRPMAGSASYVNVWVGAERKQALAIPTDHNGVARLQLTLKLGEVNVPSCPEGCGSIVVNHPVVGYDESLRVNVPYVLCEPGGSQYSWLATVQFSTEQIMQHGYVSPNLCGKSTASPKPGQLVLFVRPLSWREKLKE